MGFHTNDKKHNYFYKITNLINSKFYYGIHSTNKLNDGYMGSGKIILDAIEKYGKENFTKEIIADYPTRKEASDHEKEKITMDLILDENCYNLRTGGDNEFVYVVTDEHRLKNSIAQKNRKPITDETRQKMSNSGRRKTEYSDEFIARQKADKSGDHNPMYGKPLTIEHKTKISKKLKGKPKPAGHGENVSKSLMGHSVSAETRLKLSAIAEQQIANGQSICKPKKCIINNIEYNSIKEASIALNLSYDRVSKSLKSESEEFANWKFI